MGFTLAEEVAKPLVTPYAGGEAKRRYYQDAAIRAAFEKLARAEKQGQPKRVLLCLATGSGKTFLAVQLLRRTADADQMGRALFVCDRDELRTQALGALQNEFGNDVAAVSYPGPAEERPDYRRDVPDPGRGFRRSRRQFPADTLPGELLHPHHHRRMPSLGLGQVVAGLDPQPGRGPNRADRNPQGNRRDLRRYAGSPRPTPRSRPTTSSTLASPFTNTRWARESKMGIWRPAKSGKAASTWTTRASRSTTSWPATRSTRLPVCPSLAAELQAQYEATSYETQVMLPDRVEAMCRDLIKYLIDTGGPEQKTVIFCARDRHADDVAAMMNNLYVEWCQQQGKQPLDAFAFKCTAKGGKDYLAELRGATRSHFIATTVDLLTTGVDVPALRNIVFFKYVHSPISFYQMVGRGTRIDVPTGKLMFRVYDYTGATNLFGRKFISPPPPEPPEGPGPEPPPPPPPPPRPRIIVQGFDVEVTEAGHSIPVEVAGVMTKISVEEYKERLARRLIEEASHIGDFRDLWIVRNKRLELFGRLPDAGRSPLLVRALDQMDDYDLYDVLADLGYGLDPKTRIQRADAFFYKHAAWLAGLPAPAANTLEAIVTQFGKAGTDGLESPDIFNTS